MLKQLESTAVNFRDPAKAALDARALQHSVFGWKPLIHPTQVKNAKHAFLPSKEDLTWVREVLASLEKS